MERLISLPNSVWQIFLTLPPITQWAVSMLLVCAVIAHFFRYNEHTIHEGPSIFTTAGIFFTFLGIAEGLYAFNPQKLDASIPALLDGLKTAFIASVVGVGAALSIKLRYAIFGVQRSTHGAPPEGATVDDLYNQLVGVQQSLVGSDESTLISQLKLGRQDTNDRLDALNKSQTSFMQRMAESNSKALIEGPPRCNPRLQYEDIGAIRRQLQATKRSGRSDAGLAGAVPRTGRRHDCSTESRCYKHGDRDCQL